MRFKKGCKVEVMIKKEVPTSWRVAEIISGNGHTYSVRYDCYLVMERELGVEKVSRKVIRPCPPPVQCIESWVAGDVAEVFDDNSWKSARVLKVLGGDHYLVRPHGLTHEFSVHKLSLRVRLSWLDDKWLLMGKSSRSCGDVISKITNSNCYQKLDFQVPLANAKINQQRGDDCLPVQYDAGLQESRIVSSRTLKRVSPYCSSRHEACTGNAKKYRAIEKEGRSQRAVPSQLLEKVDAVAYPREILGEKYMHASFNNSSNCYKEMERGKSNGVVGCSLARFSEPNDSDNDECSVGSCSVVNRSPKKLSSHFIAVTCQETSALCSDAESFHASWDEEENCSSPPEEDVAASVHRLELHAYRSTLEALYACGPLSWEKEALLTNLRISLHISNDEHLIELRNLISPGADYHK